MPAQHGGQQRSGGSASPQNKGQGGDTPGKDENTPEGGHHPYQYSMRSPGNGAESGRGNESEQQESA